MPLIGGCSPAVRAAMPETWDHRYAAIAPEVAEVYARQGIELTARTRS
jgi:hypothetical protein